MNYIKQLQLENQAQEKRMIDARNDLLLFLKHLNSNKFTHSPDGERVDWIATGDCHRWIEPIIHKLEAR